MRSMFLTTATILASWVLGSATISCEDGTAGLLGVDEIAPQVAKGGGKGGGKPSTNATVALAGGMTTSEPQAVVVVASNSKKLELNTGGQATFVLSTSFPAPKAGECSISPAGADPAPLLAKLVDSFVGGRHFTLKVDRSRLGSTSAGHVISTVWSPSTDEQFVTFVSDAVVKADVVKADPTGTTFTFSGGLVKVKDRSGKPNDQVTLTCPQTRDVVATTEEA